MHRDYRLQGSEVFEKDGCLLGGGLPMRRTVKHDKAEKHMK